jgi:uncharacterized membrane protein HdeD (DUF308 family)
MNSTLARNWWLLALRGGVAILFGALAFLWPGLAWLYIVLSFAVFAIVDGVLAIIAAVKGQATGGWWWALLLEGAVGISAGVIAIVFPGLTELALLYVIAYWALVTGVFELIAAYRMRKEIKHDWALAVTGVLSIVYGLALIIMPVAGLLVIAWMIAAYSIAFGVLLLSLAFKLRSDRYVPIGGAPTASHAS